VVVCRAVPLAAHGPYQWPRVGCERVGRRARAGRAPAQAVRPVGPVEYLRQRAADPTSNRTPRLIWRSQAQSRVARLLGGRRAATTSPSQAEKPADAVIRQREVDHDQNAMASASQRRSAANNATTAPHSIRSSSSRRSAPGIATVASGPSPGARRIAHATAPTSGSPIAQSQRSAPWCVVHPQYASPTSPQSSRRKCSPRTAGLLLTSHVLLRSPLRSARRRWRHERTMPAPGVAHRVGAYIAGSMPNTPHASTTTSMASQSSSGCR
jgi:hypothetical protein